jgi:hypothetical protein
MRRGQPWDPRGRGYAPRDGEAVMDDHNAKAIELQIYDVPPEWSRRPMWTRPFLAEEGKRIHWFTPYTRSIN